jgi:UDPglucose--hexose-1-phosphate uridylyltransferase
MGDRVVAHRVRRSTGRLADGRELIYFDDSEPYVSGAATRSFVDRRRLSAHRTDAEMRYDDLVGEWVAFAIHRMERTHLPPATRCPLCPTRPGREPTEVPADDYDVVVFENRFASFGGRPGSDGGAVHRAHGRCEVVCFTSDHERNLADLGAARIRTVIEAWADRTAELSARPGVEQVSVYENHGREIGVTLPHPHGQIYAYPFVVPRTVAMLRQARLHTGRGDLLGDLLDAEVAAGARLVRRTPHWTVHVPVAARWPLEVRVVPHRHVPDLAALDDAERADLADVYADVLRRFGRFFPGIADVPYIAAWHAAPVRQDRPLLRLHLQVFSIMRAPGTLKYLAGSESGMGAWISDTTPERIAMRLRDVG